MLYQYQYHDDDMHITFNTRACVYQIHTIVRTLWIEFVGWLWVFFQVYIIKSAICIANGLTNPCLQMANFKRKRKEPYSSNFDLFSGRYFAIAIAEHAYVFTHLATDACIEREKNVFFFCGIALRIIYVFSKIQIQIVYAQ